MKEILTAVKSRKLNIYLGEKEQLKVIHEDISYQEELFNVLAVNDPDVLIVTDKLPGPLSKKELCQELVNLKKKMKIIYITSEEDESFRRFIRSQGIKDDFSIYDTDIEQELIPAILFDDIDETFVKEIISESEPDKKAEEVSKSNSTEATSEKIYIKKEIVAFVAPGGGGVGRSTIAINTAIRAATKYKKAKVVLVDFNDEKSDIAMMLDMQDKNGLNSLAKRIKEDEFNEENILKNIVQYGAKYPNLSVLTGIKNLMDSDVFLLNNYRQILEVLKSKFDLVIVDTGRFKCVATHAAIEKATRVIFMIRDTETSFTALKEKIKFYENDLAMEIINKTDIFMNMVVGVDELNKDAVIEIFAKEPLASIEFNPNIIFAAEKYNHFVENDRDFKSECKQIENVVDKVFKYYVEEEKQGFFKRFRGGGR